jgi:cleavage and polyadenylation specificity factor subunit 2
VLVSHGDMEHIGALPYLYSQTIGLSCPTFATVPVHNMGQMTMMDYYASKRDQEDFHGFGPKDVLMAFEKKMTVLRYSQPFQLSGRLVGVTITAYPAGHTLGGTIWRIKKDTDVIVYAVDYNHKKER